MKKLPFALLILIILISGCSNNENANRGLPILNDFREPVRFPFEVNEVRTEIEVYDRVSLQQYVFHYKNMQTTQEIRYILSKTFDEPERVSKTGKEAVALENGQQAFYDEDETSQSIWWERDDGFLARYFYYVNGNRDPLGDYKLKVSELTDLVDQVQ
ncbi:hypothetical protein [Paenibacillus tengchongensis]|uniref:hypothetical protein n=1 Tax=Paenibacillus tengchongensis TaxID=2608684 RepID=UPI00124E36AD|nr:hypothetical protein [Paenibacillus tengchongensis]